MKTSPRLRSLIAILSIAIGGYVFFFFLPAAEAAGSAGEGARFEIEGESAVKGLDRAGAAKSAVRNAFRKAVSQVAAKIMGKERFRRNRPAIENALLRQSDKFIRSYRVLSQSAPPSREKVKVRLEVSVDRPWVSDVLRSLRLTESKAEIVRVLFLVEERILGKRRAGERGAPPFRDQRDRNRREAASHPVRAGRICPRGPACPAGARGARPDRSRRPRRY